MSESAVIRKFHARNRKRLLITTLLAIAALFSILVTLGFGVYNISVSEAIQVFFDYITGKKVDYHDELYIINTRLPRGIVAVAIGAGLAICGVVMQNVMRNPMAEPYTMGVSSAAFFGVVIAMGYDVSLIPGLSPRLAYIVNAFFFSLIPVAIILIISRFRTLTSTSMILIGIAIMYVFSSFTQMMLLTLPSETMASAYNWRVGSLSKVTWESVKYVLPVVIIASSGLFCLSRKLDMMYMGDRNTQTVGVNPNRLRIVSMAMVSVMTATIVSFTGTIGFIGLVAPHVARMFVGSVNKYLMPFSMVIGALFLSLADMIAKISGASGLPVGVITSMVGGPLFVYILIKRGKKVWS